MSKITIQIISQPLIQVSDRILVQIHKEFNTQITDQLFEQVYRGVSFQTATETRFHITRQIFNHIKEVLDK